MLSLSIVKNMRLDRDREILAFAFKQIRPKTGKDKIIAEQIPAGFSLADKILAGFWTERGEILARFRDVPVNWG